MDGRVFLRRRCRRGHGEVVSLYEEDYALWESLQTWRVPTKQIIPDTADNDRPIPMGYALGLGELQTQHSWILLLDVTESCNLHCPTCFANSGPGLNRYARTTDLLRTLDTVITREGGRLDVLMLSGGEPTLHPDLPALLREAHDQPLQHLAPANQARVDQAPLRMVAGRDGQQDVAAQGATNLLERLRDRLPQASGRPVARHRRHQRHHLHTVPLGNAGGHHRLVIEAQGNGARRWRKVELLDEDPAQVRERLVVGPGLHRPFDGLIEIHRLGAIDDWHRDPFLPREP